MQLWEGQLQNSSTASLPTAWKHFPTTSIAIKEKERKNVAEGVAVLKFISDSVWFLYQYCGLIITSLPFCRYPVLLQKLVDTELVYQLQQKDLKGNQTPGIRNMDLLLAFITSIGPLSIHILWCLKMYSS